ncbi:MAG TPA: aldo/keto reductase, partial [Rudaea sp.]
DDYRRKSPRFQGENFARNLALVEKVGALARRKGCTTAQLALAWVLAQGSDIVPIPGTKRRKYLEQNIGSVDLVLSADDLAELEAEFPKEAVAGARYPEQMQQLVGR